MLADPVRLSPLLVFVLALAWTPVARADAMAPSVQERNKAIAIVERWAQRTHRSVQFVYTIPTNTTGTDQGAPEDQPVGA